MPIPCEHTHQSALSCAAWVRACKIKDEAVIHARIRQNWPQLSEYDHDYVFRYGRAALPGKPDCEKVQK